MSKKKETPEKKVVHTKTYTITEESFDDGSISMKRVNDGFNGMEILGLCEFVSGEVRDQIKGKIKPDYVKRSVMID